MAKAIGMTKKKNVIASLVFCHCERNKPKSRAEGVAGGNLAFTNRGGKSTLLETPPKKINYEIATAVKDKGTASQ